MHDVVRSFAEYMTREESLVVVRREQAVTAAGGGGGRHGGGWHVRRLSIDPNISVLERGTLQRPNSLRTLIINSQVNFYLPGDSLGSFSCLRVLYIRSADSDNLFPSLSKLKHLRYLYLKETNLSRLPEGIHEMKFLTYIIVVGCEKLCCLPSSFIKLVHLRCLNTTGSNVSVVPKGFGGLTNLRSLYGFPVHVDIDTSGNSWCSLEELAPISQLRDLELQGLEKVHDSWMAGKAMISSMSHLRYLGLNHSASGHTLGTGSDEAEHLHQESVIEEVLEKLCPPASLENLQIEGYTGRQLPSWMHAPTSANFKSLRYLHLENLPCCTQLPNGLCCILSLEMLDITDAPAIKHIGSEFQASSISTPFPKLRQLYLDGLPEWEEWEWNDCEEQRDVETAIAMPCLEKLYIKNSKLSCLPPGLTSSKRHALRSLRLYQLTNLTHVENFPSVVDLDVFDRPKMKRISGLPMLQKIRIIRCTKLEVLEGVPALNSLVMTDTTMDTLPEYLRAVSPRYLNLKCNRKLYAYPPHLKAAPNGTRSAILESTTSSASKIEIQVQMNIQREIEDCIAASMITHALRQG